MSTNKSSIVTARLTLDVIREEDFDSLISIFKDEIVSKTYMVPDMKSKDEEKRLFASLSNLSLRDDRYVYGIFLDKRLIGIINDTDISGNVIEIGYALHPDFFSKGYMTEALNGLIQYLFKNGFDEIVCGAFDRNTASIHVMEKCGLSPLDKSEEIEYRSMLHHCIYYSIKKI